MESRPTSEVGDDVALRHAFGEERDPVQEAGLAGVAPIGCARLVHRHRVAIHRRSIAADEEMNGEIRVVDDVPRAFAALVAAEAPRTIALSGGDTARQCYEQLAAEAVDWAQVAVLFGDERWVPVDDPDSNEGMARRALLDHAKPAAIHSMRDAADTWEGAAAAYDRLLHELGPVGLVHLGLGPDGHTASLFPGSRALAETERLVVTNRADATHPHDRLTFTFPAIAQAQLAVFTVAGAEKRDTFARIRAGDDLPATHVTAQRVIWLVDAAAVGLTMGRSL